MRDATRLDHIASEFRPRAHPLAADITDTLGRNAIVSEVERLRGSLSWVVLAAGVALPGALNEGQRKDIEGEHSRLNVIGPTFAPAAPARSALDKPGLTSSD